MYIVPETIRTLQSSSLTKCFSKAFGQKNLAKEVRLAGKTWDKINILAKNFIR